MGFFDLKCSVVSLELLVELEVSARGLTFSCFTDKSLKKILSFMSDFDGWAETELGGEGLVGGGGATLAAIPHPFSDV